MNKFIRNHKELYLGHGSSRERGAGGCGATRQVGTHCEPPWVKGQTFPTFPSLQAAAEVSDGVGLGMQH